MTEQEDRIQSLAARMRERRERSEAAFGSSLNTRFRGLPLTSTTVDQIRAQLTSELRTQLGTRIVEVRAESGEEDLHNGVLRLGVRLGRAASGVTLRLGMPETNPEDEVRIEELFAPIEDSTVSQAIEDRNNLVERANAEMMAGSTFTRAVTPMASSFWDWTRDVTAESNRLTRSYLRSPAATPYTAGQTTPA